MNSNKIRIGFIKGGAQKGDRVAVYFADGTSAEYTAQNDLTSTKVVVLGDRVFSEDVSQQINNRTSRLFKTLPEYETEEAGCQLVAASLWRAYLKIGKVNTTPPYDIAPHTNIAIDPVYLSWSYDAEDHSCFGVEDGSGQYETKEECLQSNRRPFPDRVFIPSVGQPAYVRASNNALVGYGKAGTEVGGEYAMKIKLVSSRDLAGTNLWYQAKYYDSNNPNIRRTLSYSFTDGSIKQTVGDTESSFMGVGYDFDNNVIPTYTRVTPLTGYEGLADLASERPSFEKTYPDRDIGIPNERRMLVPRESVDDPPNPINRFSYQIEYLRNIASKYTLDTQLESYFLKIHDPDLPTVKIFTFPRRRLIRPYFSFFGTKAVLIVKIGKYRNPDVTFEQRRWYQIKVIILRITSTEVVIERESDYFNNESVVSDRDIVFNNKTDYFVDRESGNPCVDDEDYDIKQFGFGFTEVNYYRAQADNTIIVHKVPGVLYGGD